jgi:type I restriction enzyme M protein
MTERKTENLLEQALKAAGFVDDDLHFQGSLEEEVQRCLPSKRSSTEGKGKPEHIVRLNGDAADILVTECKANKGDHTSASDLSEGSTLKATKYAEDGVIHYMKGLRREFNVIGLAVSGTTTADDLRISTFKCLRGGVIERLGQDKVLSRDDYLTILRNSSGYGAKAETEIVSFAKELHEYLRDHMELSEAYKPLIVSGILLGLKDNAFERSYREIGDRDDLADALYEAIKRSLKRAKVVDSKFEAMVSNYGFVKTNISVKAYLREAIGRIYRNLFFALAPNSSFDLLGSFYGEFLRYSGGDQQGLGIVLTPRHITELFSELADLNPNDSVVLDSCAGTGGFLIAAMANMVNKAAGSSALIERVKGEALVGIELDPHMFTLACANMIFRGDGKANMFWDDCLNPRDPATPKRLKELKPTVAMLNPPFSKKAKGKHELAFIKRALDLLQPGGMGIVIAPISAMIDEGVTTLEAKRELLERHTLKAVMSLPPSLFPGVGTVTAAAVFTAHQPHFRVAKGADGSPQKVPRAETWFGYWRDDGFALRKGKRVERRPGVWDEVRSKWLDAYFNQRVAPGKSCKVAVTAEDEWIAEAYLEADYSQIDAAEYEKDVKRYALFNLMLASSLELDSDEAA